jgi:hypothetical protein
LIANCGVARLSASCFAGALQSFALSQLPTRGLRRGGNSNAARTCRECLTPEDDKSQDDEKDIRPNLVDKEPPLSHCDDDLAFCLALLQIRKRILRLIERKYFVDHRADAARLEDLTDLGKLLTVWTHEQE